MTLLLQIYAKAGEHVTLLHLKKRASWRARKASGAEIPEKWGRITGSNQGGDFVIFHHSLGSSDPGGFPGPPRGKTTGTMVED